MGWHDSLAARAFVIGKSAVEFKRGARRIAVATGGLLVIAAGVWHFTSWTWALIPAALAAFAGLQSVSATLVAARLEKLEQELPRDPQNQPVSR
jgi:Flp pilus assembly protein TadB